MKLREDIVMRKCRSGPPRVLASDLSLVLRAGVVPMVRLLPRPELRHLLLVRQY